MISLPNLKSKKAGLALALTALAAYTVPYWNLAILDRIPIPESIANLAQAALFILILYGLFVFFALPRRLAQRSYLGKGPILGMRIGPATTAFLLITIAAHCLAGLYSIHYFTLAPGSQIVMSPGEKYFAEAIVFGNLGIVLPLAILGITREKQRFLGIVGCFMAFTPGLLMWVLVQRAEALTGSAIRW